MMIISTMKKSLPKMRKGNSRTSIERIFNWTLPKREKVKKKIAMEYNLSIRAVLPVVKLLNMTNRWISTRNVLAVEERWLSLTNHPSLPTI